MKTLKKIEAERAELEARIAELEIEKVAIEEAMEGSDAHKLAVVLHERMCTWNHQDGCGWGYEIRNKKHQWGGHAHARWLKNAQKVQRGAEELGIPVGTVLAVADLLEF